MVSNTFEKVKPIIKPFIWSYCIPFLILFPNQKVKTSQDEMVEINRTIHKPKN
jgi:hypothetical protein